MKNTKTKLISSVTVLLICFAMLIGSTFAWFTDSASTVVNKIQAGTLDVSLEMAKDWDLNGKPTNWVNAEGETLNWLATDRREQEEIFWEPGATYKLPALRIKNNGNLALQFKVVLSGATGDVDLLNALEFTVNPYYLVEYGGEPVKVGYHSPIPIIDGTSITNLPYELPILPISEVDEEAVELIFGENRQTGTVLLPSVSGQTGNPISDTCYYEIQAKMKTTADNSYQDKALDNISVTIVASQVTVENDSDDNKYDKDAEYPVVVASNEQAMGSIMNTASGDVNVVASSNIVLNLDSAGGYYNATLGNTDSKNVTIDAQGKKITFDSRYRNAINSYGKLTISNAKIDSTYKTEGSTWDDYALIFKYKEGGANEVVFNSVVFDRQVAIEKGVKATFNNCTINQTSSTGDMYALWIQAGADVTLNDCTINSINSKPGSNNRAIKIADEYVDNPQLTKLTVDGTTFKSQKKSAVLVTSIAGADIIWGTNNISDVIADAINPVTVDDGDTYKDLNNVKVNGVQAPVES